MTLRSSCLVAVSALLPPATAVAQVPPALTALTAEPTQLTLRHQDDRHRLLVTGTLADGSVRDLTRTAHYRSANPAVAVVDARGVVRPAGIGQTTIHVTDAGKEAAVAVTVQESKRRPVSFAHDVMPLLAKAGCSSGACHGSASGKKGFKVSLRGYDPASDFVTLTRGCRGRRLNRIDPPRSLLLLKPTGLVPHEGGKRFDRASHYGRTLTRWIAEGAHSDLDKAPGLTELQVSPALRSFPAGGLEQQLLVRARLQDGSVRDVTDDARYSSSNESTATVAEDGRVALRGKGETAIMVRYGPLVAVSRLVVLQHNPAFVWHDPPANNYIDQHVFAKLRRMEILPSELTSDEEFLRRVSYDVIGLPPTPAEVRAFLGDARPDKRVRAIDALLERPEHAEFWALKWGDLLKIRFDTTGDKGTWGLYRWLRDGIAANKPFDHVVRDLLTAQGSCAENPPANFWRVFTTPEEAAEATAQVFLGIRVLCAKCHDHPFEKWVQTDYYGLSAFFAQVGRKASGRRDDLIIVRNAVPAQSRHPRTGQVLPPRYLDGATVLVSATQDGRTLLADWLTRPDNPFLARATVNRVWGHLFGRGIIDPVDDIRSSNPPANRALLDALARDFIGHRFDVRHVLRTILNSRTYQLSARHNAFNADDKMNFSHALPRRLTAEQLLDTVSQITGVRESFQSRIPGAATVALPVGGVRAGGLPDRALTAELLDLFGRPRGESTCACERNEEASLTQALHLINGRSIAARVADPNGRLAKLVQTSGNAQLIEELYLLVLCRLPRPAEKELMGKHFAATPKRLDAAQDALWALLNSKEFLFNH